MTRHTFAWLALLVSLVMSAVALAIAASDNDPPTFELVHQVQVLTKQHAEFCNTVIKPYVPLTADVRAAGC